MAAAGYSSAPVVTGSPIYAGTAAAAGAGVGAPLMMMPGAAVMGAAPAVMGAAPPLYTDSLHFLASTPGLFVREQVRPPRRSAAAPRHVALHRRVGGAVNAMCAATRAASRR